MEIFGGNIANLSCCFALEIASDDKNTVGPQLTNNKEVVMKRINVFLMIKSVSWILNVVFVNDNKFVLTFTVNF